MSEGPSANTPSNRCDPEQTGRHCSTKNGDSKVASVPSPRPSSRSPFFSRHARFPPLFLVGRLFSCPPPSACRHNTFHLAAAVAIVRLSLLVAVAAALGSALASECKSWTGLVQMVTYVKRHPDYTRQEYWDYWQTQHAPKVAPLANHFNITRYQQIRVGGKILPAEGGAEAPSSTELVDFDGIAMFLYESAEVLTAMITHPYCLEVVETDEHVFIDKTAPGGGQVATFIGEHIEVVDRERDVWVGDDATRIKYQQLSNSYA